MNSEGQKAPTAHLMQKHSCTMKGKNDEGWKIVGRKRKGGPD
jgi:hypothetical protein